MAPGGHVPQVKDQMISQSALSLQSQRFNQKTQPGFPTCIVAELLNFDCNKVPLQDI